MKVEKQIMSQRDKKFSQLFEDNKDRIYRICCSYVRGEQNRQDLFQEIFINVWKNLDSFRSESHINTWIYRISINTSINFCRLQNKSDKRCQEIKKDILSDSEQELAMKFRQDKELEKMFEAINQLPLLEKTIVSLQLEGIDHTGIAEVCGLSEGNVRVRFHRIKKKLKQMMEEKENGF
ncbi:RNA polymerase sigma factor [uncultured Draconibacterium sp.]|uniref:RNA polymerase sigma factor n=1 Tax=uncultured Draconibacterium sp. TaxID=1573823 RepID=UPI0026158B1B|nr:RNA polymerase sigma factor [uncultured Draconibacterium sp.]